MKTICLMGDSQVAALKYGWERIRDGFPDVEITFFAGRSTDWHSLAVSDGRLVPGAEHLREQFGRSARGLQEISGDYDAYMVCGLELGFGRPLRMWTDGTHPDWEAYRTAVAAFVRQSGSAHVLATLRGITAKPARMLTAPFQLQPSTAAPPSLDAALAAKLRANFLGACETLAAEHNSKLVTQPAETIAPDGISTLRAFAAPVSPGALREDRYHCNADYGALVMTKVLKTLFGPIAD